MVSSTAREMGDPIDTTL